jgi:hypothetical protein
MMKNVLRLLSIFLLTGFTVGAQDSDYGRIGFYPVILPDNIEDSYDNWTDDFSLRLSSFGLVNTSQSRFVCGLKVTIDQEELAGSNMYIMKATVTISVADIISSQKYGVFQVRGVKSAGANRTKATKGLLRALNAKLKSDVKFENFLNDCKGRIITYYNENCDEIQRNAQTQTQMRNFEIAISDLLSVPNVSSSCFNECQELGIKYNLERIEYECAVQIAACTNFIAGDDYESAFKSLQGIDPLASCYDKVLSLQAEIASHWCSLALGEASGAWASRDSELASFYLSQIPMDSECAVDAQKLATEMGANLDKWKERDYEFKKDEVLIEKLRIKAARDVGMEYARNQPRERVVIINRFPW